ncbi:MAG: Mur ligase family protein [Candidatus Magasanikbacteria bacterium]|nr:Mur ligase family protein [Candidatus Magasanikbacteria bacterium]
MSKHLHFIGICGVAMSALAIAFKKVHPDQNGGAGYKITGSDVGFYPPVSTHLKDAGVDFYPGWHPDKMMASGAPNLVVVGNVASSHNPEWLYVQEHKLNYKSYPEVIRDFFIKTNSIVCAGTFGKSTSTALLTWIFKYAKINPSYMFGGISLNEMPAADLGQTNVGARHAVPLLDGQWSIVEGDEYKTARWDNSPKFDYYKPTHLLLTSVVWDHADVYPTEKSYFEVFQKLYNSVPKTGLRIISEKALPLIKHNGETIISYGKTAGCDYVYANVVETVSGVSFNILYKNQSYPVATTCLGEYMADNATGCFAMALECGLEPNKIIAAIKSFKGVKRRLEKRLDGKITVFDTIAHSPTKAQADLASLRQVYKNKIIAVFEPNSGNREPAALPGYAHAFSAASEVIVPKLTKIKTSPTKALPIEGDELATVIAATHTNVKYIDDDQKLITYIKNQVNSGDVVVFLGSHGFRGMIEELITSLRPQSRR